MCARAAAAVLAPFSERLSCAPQTYTAYILIAVNPYKQLPIYSDQKLLDYQVCGARVPARRAGA